MDDTGKELITPVKPWAATSGVDNTGATVDSASNNAKTYTPADGSEISVVGWKETT